MESEEFYGVAYKGSRQINRNEKRTHIPGVSAAANDHMEHDIDLNAELVRNKPSTYFFRMKGDAMKDAGIFDNDVLIVDRSLKPVNGKVIVGVLNGEMLVRRFHKNFTSAFLIPENNRYKNINLAEFTDFTVWGVVTFVIHPV